MAGEFPITAFHFSVDFTGISPSLADVRFQSVSGLSATIETEEVREGGENRFKHKLPTGVSYEPLILKRALVTDSALMQWCLDGIDNFMFKPIDLLIKLLDEAHLPAASWNVVRAFPVRWSVCDFEAQKSEMAIETLQLQYNYFKRVSL